MQSAHAGFAGFAARALNATRKSFARRRKQFGAWYRRPNLFDAKTPERVGMIFSAPSEMTTTERLFLYSFVRGQRPQRILEIGTRHGGSASIMAAALEDSQRGDDKTPGQIIGVDPAPNITVRQRDFFNRFTLITKPSPDAIPEARQRAGGPFNLVLIDGLHIYEQAVKDIGAVTEHLAENAYVLFHDAFHYGVHEAIVEAIGKNPHLIDCGYPCSRPATSLPPLAYGGLRLLRYTSQAIIDPQPIINLEFEHYHKAVPLRDPTLFNHDEWYCRVVKPCAYCRKKTLLAAVRSN